MTNSLVNMMMSGTKGQPEPEVGMGGTILMWTDRTPVTIIGLVKYRTGKNKGKIRAVTVQYDKAKRVDNNGMSEQQEWEFTRNLDGAQRIFTRRPNGAFIAAGDTTKGGTQLRIGSRDKYHDFSF
jgi:hypothetical protein